jgi:hypothetical protein
VQPEQKDDIEENADAIAPIELVIGHGVRRDAPETVAPAGLGESITNHADSKRYG